MFFTSWVVLANLKDLIASSAILVLTARNGTKGTGETTEKHHSIILKANISKF